MAAPMKQLESKENLKIFAIIHALDTDKFHVYENVEVVILINAILDQSMIGRVTSHIAINCVIVQSLLKWLGAS